MDSQRFNKKGAEQTDVMITLHDKAFNIIYANNRAKKILQLPTLRKSSKAKCYQYYHGKKSPPNSCPSCKCLLTNEPVTYDIYEPHLNRRIEINAVPNFDSNGEFLGLIHFVRDITDKRILSNKCCE